MNSKPDKLPEECPGTDPPPPTPDRTQHVRSGWLWGFLALLFVIVVIGLPLAWFFSGPERQRRAVTFIREKGGKVTYASEETIFPGWVPVDYYLRPVELRLSGCRDADECLEQFPNIDTLTYIDLTASDVSDLGIARLAGASSLVSLHLGIGTTKEFLFMSGAENDHGGIVPTELITDDGLAALAQLPALEDLDLSRRPISGEGMRHLRGLPLRKLRIGSTQVTDDGLRHLAPITTLEELDFADTPITCAGFDHLAGLPKLTNCGFGQLKIDDEGLAHLSGLSHLRSLDLTGMPITDRGMASLARMKSLTSLNLSGTQISDLGVAKLASLPLLESLTLSDTKIYGPGLEPLAGIPTLRVLCLDGTQIDDTEIEPLGAWKLLEFIDVRNTRIGDAGLIALTKIPSLETLVFSETGVNPTFQKVIEDELKSRREKKYQRLDGQ